MKHHLLKTILRVFVLSPLFLACMAACFWQSTVNPFFFMIRDNIPFSLERLCAEAWGEFSFWGVLLAPPCFILTLLCVFWWRKPSFWRYLLPALWTLLICGGIALSASDLHNYALSGHAAYRQQLPAWFPLLSYTAR